MAAGFSLPPPSALEIHDANVAEKWKKFHLAWDNYSLATELNKKHEKVQVATLLTIIGEEARDVHSTFTDWESEESKQKITPVLDKFAAYCQPRRNILFERYRFNKRAQEPGESYDQYKTELRKLAENCDFYSITTDEILRDRLIFGIRDGKVRKRLLRESQLTLEKTDEICRASESTASQMKEVSGGESVSAFESETKARRRQHKKQDRNKPEEESDKPCGNCGCRHEPGQCCARGRACNTCGKMGHFASVCRSGKLRKERVSRTRVKTIEQHEDNISDISAVTLDDSQLVPLKLVNSGSFFRFQPDTGAQCNVIPVHLYKQACNDEDLSNVRTVKSTFSAFPFQHLSGPEGVKQSDPKGALPPSYHRGCGHAPSWGKDFH